jgi:hypothetical protein
MITVFERIPDLFVQLYDPQFQLWAAEFKKRGKKCAIVFNPPPGAKPTIDEEGRVIAAGCWLEAQVEITGGQPHVIIRPASDHDEEMIARHCHEMTGHVLQ